MDVSFPLDKHQDIIARRIPAELFELQVALAIEQGVHIIFGMDAQGLSQSLEPLLEIAQDIPKSDPGNISCLLVFPYECIPRKTKLQKRKALVQQIKFAGEKIKFDGNPAHNYMRWVKDTQEVPQTTYLAIDVSLGGDLEGIKDCKEVLKIQNRKPSTFDEGIALHLLYGSAAPWAGIRLVGTNYADYGWPDMCIENSALLVDNHTPDMSQESLWNMWAPHCSDRIGL